MAIPVYRHNSEYGDWEPASVYGSDDCDSLGRSATYESSYRSDSRDDAAFQLQRPLYGGIRPHADYVPHPQLQQQHRNYPPVAFPRSRWDTRHMPEKRNNFVLPPAPIIPPPGVIFPAKDWVLPPQDIYSPPPADHIAPTSNMPVTESPPPSLLLAPSSPPAPPPLIMRPSPIKPIAHGQTPHAMSATASNTGTGLNVNSHTSPIMPPPPRYHELGHTISPRLADAGCQAHSNLMTSPRRPGHDVLSSCGPEAMPRGPPTNEEMRVEEERFNYGSGQTGYGPGDRPPAVPSKYEYEHEHGYDGGRMTARPSRRERRPSIWQRFVRRFSPSRGISAGHT